MSSEKNSRLPKKIGRVLMDAADPAEKLVRRLSGLPAQAPNPHGFTFGEPDERGNRQLLSVSDDAHNAGLEAWHEEGRRGHIASQVSRGIHRAGYALDRGVAVDRLLSPARKAAFERELARAYVIRWEAWHYAAEGQSTHIDGSLILPSGRRMGFDVRCVGNARYWAGEAIRMGGVQMQSDPFGCDGPVLPTEVLTPALVEVAIRAWYVAKFEWVQGHWSIRTKTLPRLVVDAGCWDEAPAEDADKLARAAAKAERDVVKMLSDEQSVATYALFGAPAVPTVLTDSLAARKAAAAAKKSSS